MLEKTCEKEKNAIGALTCARTKDLSRSVLWQASMHAAAHCIDNAMTIENMVQTLFPPHKSVGKSI